ncbi:BAG family molecular chaperone regulator 2 isoform X3 [Scaptodrosophila lebanonensis]|uniref:BAG family molecular chaperone regulator 2 isoform X3 n=1 Tax=Drosophila lebanonensis TaxID=7225 RepID=A0A6J2TH01_DROLE|nr:BAG family molecular chaperone regulator 2 isoform X3 [Scaptodrosophila lebanonensis]
MLASWLGIFRKRRHFDAAGPAAEPQRRRQNIHGNDKDDYSLPVNWTDDYFFELQNNRTELNRPFNANERFVSILDQLDARVEKFRKDALNLQEKKDYLLMSMDLIKSNEMLQNMSDAEREEIICYIQRVNSRLGTVELNVRTVRDNSQEDSLSQINALIDTMIKMGDPVIARQRCQLYLNACCSSSMDPHLDTLPDADMGPIDKKFESVLLGCTLDDQKNIKKRLQALMGYLNKQTVSN